MTRDTGHPPTPQQVLSGLDQRLAAAAAALIPGTDPTGGGATPGASAAILLPRLVDRCRTSRRIDEWWLLLTAVQAALPTPDALLSLVRFAELNSAADCETHLLAQATHRPGPGRPDLPMLVVDHGVVLDVDFCAKHDVHTGIQRVVRAVMSRWGQSHEIIGVAWTDDFGALRSLERNEERRVYEFGMLAELHAAGHTDVEQHESAAADTPHLVVPWHSFVVLPEVPPVGSSARLACLAQHSGNHVAVVGYDLIPIISAELRPEAETLAATEFLTVIKYARTVAAISESSAAEFGGVAAMFRAQGLPGPAVRAIPLPAEIPPARVKAHPRRRGRPRVVLVGTREPHKNHRGVLQAAELLWNEGLDFEVRLIGGAGWNNPDFAATVARLQHENRPVVDLGRLPDGSLWSELRDASFSVFASLHEGFGLPVAESLAAGTPVVTTSYGSQGEIAAAGGCLVADPRDDAALATAMRTLLTDHDTLARLREEIGLRPQRTWDDYADELWDFLTRVAA